MALNKNTDLNPSYRWHNLANSYLELAAIGLSCEKNKKNYKILLPIIFCIKHGIELYLKGLNVESDYHFISTHDQKRLFLEIYNQLDYSTRDNPKNKETLQGFIKIIKKYYINLIGGQQLFESPDEKNMQFRYLQKEKNVYCKLKNLDINQVKKDIQDIVSFGNLLNIHLQLNKNNLNHTVFFDNQIIKGFFCL